MERACIFLGLDVTSRIAILKKTFANHKVLHKKIRIRIITEGHRRLSRSCTLMRKLASNGNRMANDYSKGLGH